MKILLDECIDRKLAREFPKHDVKTVPQMGWAGVKNGQLLALAKQEFDVFITVDRNLSLHSDNLLLLSPPRAKQQHSATQQRLITLNSTPAAFIRPLP
ncbi:MAG: DUF5615 family PIN-like protein [Elainellaceae cyanobacterium]